jgi:methyl-accepting chemotaxis protein
MTVQMAPASTPAVEAPLGSDADTTADALRAVAAEMADYAKLVEDAQTAVRRNGELLGAMIESSARQDELVRDTAAAVGQVSAEASQIATTVERLESLIGDAGAASGEAAGALADVSGALSALRDGLASGADPLARIGGSLAALAAMLETLDKLARGAELLAVNAAIEAAHVHDGGVRFAIVASEVRAVAGSTRKAAGDVRLIAVDLRTAAGSVDDAVRSSARKTGETAGDVTRSRTTLEQAQQSVAELEVTVGALGSASGEQSAALGTVAASVEEIALHATAVMSAIADAGALDLDGHVRSARERLAGWSGERDAGSAKAVYAAADAEQRLLLSDLVQLAVSVAYNGVAWRSVESALVALRGEVEQVRQTVTESTVAARSASSAASSMRSVASSMKERYDQAMDVLDHGLAAIETIETAVADADRLVERMTAAVERTNDIVTLIGAVAADTGLLSLNAAIESARAGATGRAFSVIAGEIRRLASATEEVSRGVSTVIGDVAADSALVRTAIGEVRERARAVTEAALGVRAAVGTLRFSLDETLRSADEVSHAAEEQVRGLERVVENAGRSVAALDGVRTAQTGDYRLELYALGDRAHRIAARRGVAVQTAEVRRFVDGVATQIEAVFDDAIASRRVSAERCFELSYDELRGNRVRELARLFDVTRVPASGFDPPKYATPWDAAVDEAIIALLDDALTRAAFARPIVIAASDLNGFMYAYPRRHIEAWTGVDATDRKGNRVKRLLDDEHALRLVRMDLGPGAASVGKRAPYAAFQRAGCALERPAGERPWQLSVFARDINDVVNDLVVPIYVRGRRHGAVRFGYDRSIL